MNVGKLILSVVAAFVFVYVFEFVFHSFILGESYKATENLWRKEDDMMSHMGWMVLGHLCFALGICLCNAWFNKAQTPAEGIKIGISFGVVGMGSSFVFFTVMPLPTFIPMMWIVDGFIVSIITGLIAGAIYKTKAVGSGE